MKRSFLLLLVALLPILATAQVYTQKQSRHRFAQLTLGLDYQSSIGGSTHYKNSSGVLVPLDLPSTGSLRFLIGGTHFWGHADIYIAIPFRSPTFQESQQAITYFSGVETVFKYYPWRITSQALRPFIGISLSSYYYEQDNGFLEFGNGPDLNHTSFPLVTGLTYNRGSHLVEAGVNWNYDATQLYYLDRATELETNTPPLYFNLSYRYMLETTLSAEPSWESGQAKRITEQLADKKQLDNLYFGVGLSSAFWLGNNTYNEVQRPFVDPYSNSVMLDLTLGYYWHKPDMNAALSYRSYSTSTNTYGVLQRASRRSIVLEAAKSLFDYHGFVPFLGPALSYDQLQFEESFENQSTQDLEEEQLNYGITFGWDIRPNRIQSWLLRTNLRWFPNLKLAVDQQEISFSALEFNFIQLVIFPGRFFGDKLKL